MNCTSQTHADRLRAATTAAAAFALLAAAPCVHAGDGCEPVLVSTTETVVTEILDVEGDHVFLTGSGDLEIFDISDPANVTLVASVESLGGGPIKAAGDYVYLSSQLLYVVDVHDISAPAFVGQSENIGQNPSRAIDVAGDIACVSGSNGMTILDISDPTDPHVIGAVTGFSSQDVDIVGSTVFVSARLEGLHAYDISNPAAPALLGSYNLDDCWGATIVNGIAYIGTAFDDGLHVVDVSDPSAMTLLGSAVTGVGFAGTPSYSSGIVYLSADTLGVQVIDVNDPANPFLVDSINPFQFPSQYTLHLEYANGYVFAQSPSEFHAIDVTTCGSPFITQHPQSVVAAPGEIASFTVAANGASLSYQWRFNGEVLGEGGAYIGTQTPTLGVSASLSAVGLYDCVVSNAEGQVVSNSAVLAVLGGAPACPPDITGDGIVGVADLLTVIGAWGACP